MEVCEGFQRPGDQGAQPAVGRLPGLHPVPIGLTYPFNRGAHVEPQGYQRFHVEVVRGRQIARHRSSRSLTHDPRDPVLFPGSSAWRWSPPRLRRRRCTPSGGRKPRRWRRCRTRRPNRSASRPAALDKMDAGMQDLVDKKHLAGIVTLVARKGKVVQHKAYGMQDLEKQAPMKTDTIARIYSMTKPVTGVAMMMLYEEGKWKPSDPIAKHIPEFANLKVYAGEKDGAADPRSAGASADDGRVDVAYGGLHLRAVRQHAGGQDVSRGTTRSTAPSLQAFIDRLAKLPLLYQPGTRWVYSVSVDIQGYLVEKLSGQDVPRVPAHAALRTARHGRHRRSSCRPRSCRAWRRSTRYDKAKAGARAAAARSRHHADCPDLPSGGGGLYGTAGGLLPLRADAAQRRRVRTASAS